MPATKNNQKKTTSSRSKSKTQKKEPRIKIEIELDEASRELFTEPDITQREYQIALIKLDKAEQLLKMSNTAMNSMQSRIKELTHDNHEQSLRLDMFDNCMKLISLGEKNPVRRQMNMMSIDNGMTLNDLIDSFLSGENEEDLVDALNKEKK